MSETTTQPQPDDPVPADTGDKQRDKQGDKQPVDHLSRPRTIIVATLLAASVISGGVLVQRGVTAPDIPPLRGPMLFDQVQYYIGNLYLDTLTDSVMYRAAIDGMLADLGESDNAYLSPARAKQIQAPVQGKADVGIDSDVRAGMAVIINVMDGSPASQAGIVRGDRILSIDGKSVAHWTSAEVDHALQGAAKSRVTLAIDHPGNPIPMQHTLVREQVVRRTIPNIELWGDSIGYLRIGAFSDWLHDTMQEEVEKLVERGARSLIVDVRKRTGGDFLGAVAAADLMLDSGTVLATVVARDTIHNQSYIDSTAQQWPELSLIVLVDGWTSGAAEVFAGALQDHDRAVVIGTPSYGKGSEHELIPVNDTMGVVSLSVARWYTPLGRQITRVDYFGNESSAEDDLEPPTFETPHGRTITGGGGIVPDVILAARPVLDDSVTSDSTVLADSTTFPDSVRHSIRQSPQKTDPILMEARKRLQLSRTLSDLLASAMGGDTVFVDVPGNGLRR